ncbi:hypothetical protein [Nocardioides sp. AE5]|nr:hypothetical protein [Nocardioides sp. AE5]MDT0202647.1 hypothetical protein [Nocardioides sp. AE5]
MTSREDMHRLLINWTGGLFPAALAAEMFAEAHGDGAGSAARCSR